ncbi:MAG TPA: hypothetical protein VJP88_08540, partial [Caulobacteraceae bacterium]|nr:hypothetical protein [Caulobacteraceae bacterium]
INISDDIPVAISAFGPKARAMVAELGTYWINFPLEPDRDGPEMEEMRALWRDRGRDLKDLYPIAIVGGRVLDEGEAYDSPKAKAQAGPHAASIFHGLVEQTEKGAVAKMTSDFPFAAELEAYRKVYLGYEPSDARYTQNHRGHRMFLRPDETHVTGAVIRALTMTGTKAELVERMRALKEVGYKQVQIDMMPGQEDDIMQRWSDVMAAV